MSRALLVAAGRRAAEAGMVDACRITRVTATVTDEDTGDTEDTVVEVYAGRCRIQQENVQGQREEIAEASRVLLRLQVQLPMTVAGLREGDLVAVEASLTDPDLPGRRFVVRDLAHKTDATARRVGCVEVTS